MIGSIVLFILILVLLVLVHEWGHFYAAKKLGVRVDEFGIGFPPKLYGKKVGETEYTLNALPLGGFVKIWGETPEEVAGVPEEERKRSFGAQARWKQAVILGAGVAMNVVLAWVLYTIGFFVGVPTVVDEGVPEAQGATLTVTAVLPESPAAEHLVPGDVITNLAVGTATLDVYTPSSVSAFIARGSTSEPVTFTIMRGKEVRTVAITPEQGLVESEPDRLATGIMMGLVTFESHGIMAPVSALGRLWGDTVMITTGFATLVGELFTGDREMLSQVAGPVGIAGLVGDAATLGFVWVVMFTGIISLNLAVLNLLPIPALDGGRLVIVALEALLGKTLNPQVIGITHAVSFVILIILMVLVTVQDVTRLL
jgi:regulator of sigma E protease